MDKFDILVQKYRRDINCLTDENRNTRLVALRKLLTELPKEPEDELREKLFINCLIKPLTYAFEDKIEKNREIAIKIVSGHIEKFGFTKDYDVLLTAALARLNGTPFPEQSEEVRISFINLIKLMVDKNEVEVIPFLSDLSNTLARVLLDPNPAMKENCARFLGVLAGKLKAKLGHYVRPILNSLVVNITHQRSLIRRLSMRAIGDVVKTDCAAPLLKDIMGSLKFLLGDKIPDVRKQLYVVVREWLASFDYTYLKTFECDLISILLTGVGDESIEISELCIESLNFYGTNLRKLLEELKEDTKNIDPNSFDVEFQKRMASI